MNAATAIEPVTVLKTRSAQLIKDARTSGQPIIITQNGKATAVLQDVETYEQQRQALLLLKFLAQGDQELKRGQGIPHAATRRHFDETLRNLAGA
jgi:prevent-host-death family protein